MILPELTEAKSPFFRPIEYSLFPPLSLATLAAHLGPDDEVELVDEHVETLRLDDETPPELVVISVYITNARRAYAIADRYRKARQPRGAGWPARHLTARRGRRTRRLAVSRTGRRHVPRVLA
jgi:hypothetical protein